MIQNYIEAKKTFIKEPNAEEISKDMLRDLDHFSKSLRSTLKSIDREYKSFIHIPGQITLRGGESPWTHQWWNIIEWERDNEALKF